MDFEKWSKIAEKIPEYRRGGTAGMAPLRLLLTLEW